MRYMREKDSDTNNKKCDDSNQIQNNLGYELPEISKEIPCPICKCGKISINRTPHTLPDNEEILIVLIDCDSCGWESRDIITINTRFGPGTYTCYITNGDLTHKIFKGPSGNILIPEADFEIEPGTAGTYTVTNLEGIFERAITWTEYMLNIFKQDKRPETKKVEETLAILQKMNAGEMPFHFILKDEVGGSYIAPSIGSKVDLRFEPFIPDPSS
jgi:zinc finger protein